MSWEKIGVTVVSKPVAHGSGIYFRISKRIAEAYELFTAAAIEVTIDRALRQEADASITGLHITDSPGVSARKSVQNTGSESVVSPSPRRSARGPRP